MHATIVNFSMAMSIGSKGLKWTLEDAGWLAYANLWLIGNEELCRSKLMQSLRGWVNLWVYIFIYDGFVSRFWADMAFDGGTIRDINGVFWCFPSDNVFQRDGIYVQHSWFHEQSVGPEMIHGNHIGFI